MIRNLLSPPHMLLLYGLCAAVYMLRQYMRRKRHRFAGMLLGTGSGIAGLLLLHCSGDAWGLALPLMVFHCAVAAIGGLPGVLLLIAMHLLGI